MVTLLQHMSLPPIEFRLMRDALTMGILCSLGGMIFFQVTKIFPICRPVFPLTAYLTSNSRATQRRPSFHNNILIFNIECRVGFTKINYVV